MKKSLRSLLNPFVTLRKEKDRLLYPLIKIIVRLALKVFCRKINLRELVIENTGPVLITANHPNSFLDAVIIGALCNRPVHFLARGDVFTKPWHSRLLRLLHMIPVYRLSEGKENLYLNEHAFRQSSEILAQKGIVLIFIEGICVNEHNLQPIKKGAARIAIENRERKDFSILPVAIAYDSFERFGKKVTIRVGKSWLAEQLFPFEEEAKNTRNFNAVLYKQLSTLIEVPSADTGRSETRQLIFFLPGIAGYALHFFFYRIIKKILKKKTSGTVFFDSVLFGALLFLYPLYLFLLCLIVWLLGAPMFIIAAVFLITPFLAWSAVQWRRSF